MSLYTFFLYLYTCLFSLTPSQVIFNQFLEKENKLKMIIVTQYCIIGY